MEALVVSSKPWIDACWWKGDYKLYHSVWELPIMCVAWKISPSLGCYVDNESIPLKISFTSISKPSCGTSTNPCFPLRRAYLFTFMLCHHPLIKKHQLESTPEDLGLTKHCNSWQKRSSHSHTQCKLIAMHVNDIGALQLVLFNKRMMTQHSK